MKLLSENELVWSDVVANNNMNRKRRSSGVNSYEKELKFKPENHLNALLKEKEQVKWLDLCCGEGNALLQYAAEIAGKKWQQRVVLKGIDLVDAFQPVPAGINCLEFQVQPLSSWVPMEHYDLITCVHGLHYVGDKLDILNRSLQALAPNSILLAHLDLNNIKIEGRQSDKYLKPLFKNAGIAYDSRNRLVKAIGPRHLPIDLLYKGANDKAGPNYTGQPVVDSYYSIPT